MALTARNFRVVSDMTDHRAIETWTHVSMLHIAAKPLAGQGKLVVASYGQDAQSGRNLPPVIRHFEIGDVASMDRAIRELSRQQHRNVYVPLAVFSNDLPPGKKGGEDQIAGVLGLVADFDDADAHNYQSRLPAEPSFVMETSGGRFQAGFLFDAPVSRSEAKPLAEALADFARCDHGTKDLCHVWRVPGTYNWPNKKKVDGGRSAEPQTVNVCELWAGARISAAKLRAAIGAAQAAKSPGLSHAGAEAGQGVVLPLAHARPGPLPSAPAQQAPSAAAPVPADVQGIMTTLPDRLRDKIQRPTPQGARSEALCHVISELKRRGYSGADIASVIRAHPSGIGEKYAGRDDLDKEIARIFALNIDDATGAEARPAAPPRRLDLNDWPASRYGGEVKPRRWLVDGVLPLGVPGMIAAMGDTGKSMLMLDLAVKIATGGDGVNFATALGGRVAARGTAVIVTAEDDAREVHERLDGIDPLGKRLERPERLRVVPLPDAGGGLTLVRQGRSGIELTPEAEGLFAQLRGIGDLRLVVFDPLQAFVEGDLNADPAVAQFLCSALARLAAETGAAVVVTHHMRKGNRKEDIADAAGARDAIRGTTALVDGLRFAYALWPMADYRAKKLCERLGRPWRPGVVVHGAVVKANGPANKLVRTYLRNGFGLLQDATEAVKAAAPQDDDLLAALERAVGVAAAAGRPYTKTGANGLYGRRSELGAALSAVGKHRLDALAQKLLDAKRAVLAMASGSRAVKYLDLPDGPFARGEGQFSHGAHSTAAAAETAGGDGDDD
jgi:hypothetical protein